MKKVAISKALTAIPAEANDETGRDMILGTMEVEFPDYRFQCDELNNGPAEQVLDVIVVDVWEGDGIKYTRFVINNDGTCDYHDKP